MIATFFRLGPVLHREEKICKISIKKAILSRSSRAVLSQPQTNVKKFTFFSKNENKSFFSSEAKFFFFELLDSFMLSTFQIMLGVAFPIVGVRMTCGFRQFSLLR